MRENNFTLLSVLFKMSFGAGAFKVEAVVVSIQDRGFSGFANNMIKIPVKNAKKDWFVG